MSERRYWQPENPGPSLGAGYAKEWLDAVFMDSTNWPQLTDFLAEVLHHFTKDVCLGFDADHGGLCLRYRGCSEDRLFQPLGPDDLGRDVGLIAEHGYSGVEERKALLATRETLARMLSAVDRVLAATPDPEDEDG